MTLVVLVERMIKDLIKLPDDVGDLSGDDNGVDGVDGVFESSGSANATQGIIYYIARGNDGAEEFTGHLFNSGMALLGKDPVAANRVTTVEWVKYEAEQHVAEEQERLRKDYQAAKKAIPMDFLHDLFRSARDAAEKALAEAQEGGPVKKGVLFGILKWMLQIMEAAKVIDKDIYAEMRQVYQRFHDAKESLRTRSPSKEKAKGQLSWLEIARKRKGPPGSPKPPPQGSPAPGSAKKQKRESSSGEASGAKRSK